MAKEPLSCKARDRAGAVIRGNGNGFASLEAAARALGYTDKEQAIACDILKRFSWRHVEQSPEQVVTASEEGIFAADDLEAAS